MGAQPKNFKDLTGMRFGRLTVLERGPSKVTPKGQRKTQWWCSCSCGNPDRVLVAATALNSGHTMSCGCLQREATSAVRKRENRYVFQDDHIVGYTQEGTPFYIDSDDYENVHQYSWYQTSNGYIATRDREKGGELLTLHRKVMGARDDELVDHINHDKTDNRKQNLRIVTRSQNQQNMKVPSHNSSGVRGVSWSNYHQNWVTQIWVDGEHHYLGAYKNFDDAVAARKAAEEKYFGEYSYDNSIAAVPRIAV